MYLYKFGVGHQGRNSNLAALHESDSGPMELTKLREIPHNRNGILLHNVRLNPQEARKERTHGHLSVLCAMTHSNSHRSLNCPLSPYFGIPRPMINQTDAGKMTAAKADYTHYTHLAVSKQRWYASFASSVWYNLDVPFHCDTQHAESWNDPLQRGKLSTREDPACVFRLIRTSGVQVERHIPHAEP